MLKHTSDRVTILKTIENIIKETKFEIVYQDYAKHYDVKYKYTIKKVYDELKSSISNVYRNTPIIYITAYIDNGKDKVIQVCEFDFDNADLCFDISVKIVGDNDIYSLCGMEYSDLLGCYIDEDTLSKYTASQIIALILWEIDW